MYPRKKKKKKYANGKLPSAKYTLKDYIQSHHGEKKRLSDDALYLVCLKGFAMKTKVKCLFCSAKKSANCLACKDKEKEQIYQKYHENISKTYVELLTGKILIFDHNKVSRLQ